MNRFVRQYRLRIYFAFTAIGLLPHFLAAQSPAREKIDEERKERMSFTDAKTLDKARSFILRDSTYYVGHFMEGGYLFFRANDKLGFTKAIEPLKRALRLIEKDFDVQLRTRTNNFYIYNGVYRYHSDYGIIAYFLERSYQNVEQQDQAMDIVRHVRDRNFQMELGVDSYNTMAWIYHRNRTYTSRQFPFLKNTVRENVTAAQRCLDSALLKLRDDASLNVGLFDAQYVNRQYLSTYHYEAMIADYKLEIDSANEFYNVLIRNDAYSPNNYAEFNLAMGELPKADFYFKQAERREASVERNTKEYYYMRGTLDTYRGHPDSADSLLRKVLERQGSTPGFGWHSIGLARALHYEGLTVESQERADKAAHFQELHLGTTWGQEQYNMAVASLNYINQLQLEKEYFFENDQWWFWLNPVNWYMWIKYSLEIHHYKLLLASLIAENPERDQVIYSIFSSENLICFDEVWSAIHGFGSEYFIKLYKRRLEHDKRPNLKKYFRYFLGKLYLDEGNTAMAAGYFQEALNDPGTNDSYGRMLRARIFEGLALTSQDKKSKQYWTLKFYDAFPQLVPFSELTMQFHLETTEGATSETAQEVMKSLKNCSLEFVAGNDVPGVLLQFTDTGDALEVNFSVRSVDQSRLLQQGKFKIRKQDASEGGKLLAYQLFGIHKKPASERPEIKPIPV